MTNTMESGHAVNIGNFDQLISQCESYGTNYNPSNPAITLAALKTKQTKASAAMDDLDNNETSLSKLLNNRNLVFDPLKPFCTRVMNAFKSSGASTSSIANLTTINRKIQGGRADDTKVVAAKTAKTAAASTTSAAADTADSGINSVSQQGFDDTVEHFSKMVATVKLEPLYKPNEEDLAVTALDERLAGLKATNKAAKAGQAAYDKALAARDAEFYGAGTGLVDLAKDVKSYVKSVYGASGPEFLKLSRIPFKNL